MFRKSAIAIAAIAALGATALIPTEAAAHYRHFGHFGHFGRVIVPTAIVVGAAATVAPACGWQYGWYRGFYVKRWACY